MRRIFGLLKLNKNEFRRFAEEDRVFSNNSHPFLRLMCWYDEHIKFKSDYEMQRMKYTTEQEHNFQ